MTTPARYEWRAVAGLPGVFEGREVPRERPVGFCWELWPLGIVGVQDESGAVIGWDFDVHEIALGSIKPVAKRDPDAPLLPTEAAARKAAQSAWEKFQEVKGGAK